MAVAAVVLALGLGACSGVSREGEPQQIGQSPGGQSGGTAAPATTAAPVKCPTEPVQFGPLAPWAMVKSGQAGTPDRWESTFTIANPTSLPALFSHVTATVQVQRAGLDRLGVVGNGYLPQKAVDPFGDPVQEVVVPPRSMATVSIGADMVRATTGFQSRDIYQEGWLMVSKYWFKGFSVDKSATCPMTVKGAQPIDLLPAGLPSCSLGGAKYPC